VRADFDLVSGILSTKIMPDVIDYARKRSYLVEDLYKERANKTELLGNFLRRYPLVVWLASHGFEDAVIGPEEGQTIADLANTVWFNGKIVVINACLTGRKLAPAMVESGAKAVFAFVDLLTLRVDANTYEPLPGFKECLTKPKVLYDGVNAKDAYDATIAEYNKWIDFWDKEDPTTADVLRADRDAFMMFGTGESKVALSTYVFMGMTDIFILAFIILWGILQSVRAIMPLLRRS
jgi:hypothetical protein